MNIIANQCRKIKPSREFWFDWCLKSVSRIPIKKHCISKSDSNLESKTVVTPCFGNVHCNLYDNHHVGPNLGQWEKEDTPQPLPSEPQGSKVPPLRHGLMVMMILTWSREIEELLEDSALSNPESPSLAFLKRKIPQFPTFSHFRGLKWSLTVVCTFFGT